MRKGLALGVVLGLIGFLYFTGRMDHALYPVGLNYHTCARNGFGAVFCGSELTQYESRINGAQRQLQQTEQSITSSESATLQSITSSETAAQESITQAECQADPSLSVCP